MSSSSNFDGITQDDNTFTNMGIKETETNKSFCQKIKEYVLSTKMIEVLGCITLGLVLAFVPSVIVPVNQRPIPYQMTNEGDVLLDLTKYQEYVDSTVPSKLIFECYILSRLTSVHFSNIKHNNMLHPTSIPSNNSLFLLR